MSKVDLLIKRDEEDLEVAEVQINGLINDKLYRFILDTGSAITCIKNDDYTTTLESVGKKSSSGVFGQTSDDLITIPYFQLGPIVKKNLTIARIDSKKNEKIRNLIGMDVLKDYSIYFSFDENMIELNPQHISGRTVQELELSKVYHPYVTVKIGNIKASSVWDSGAGITIVDLDFIKRNLSFFKEVEESNGTDSTGTKQSTPMYIMDYITIGNHKFPPHKVAGVNLTNINNSSDCHIDMILGYSTLSKANWLFDFPNRRWSICKML